MYKRQELHATEDADREADEPDDGVEVAAGDPQDHAQRAAEEDKRGDHDERAEHEAGHRGGAAAGEELLTEVFRFLVNSDGSFKVEGYYPAHSLHKTVVIDEDGHTSESFTDISV